MEQWKAIVGYEGIYEISDIGRVKSLKYGKEKILKPGKLKNGYLHVILYKEGKKKIFKIHRLVAEAFIPNPLGLETVNHMDEVKTNNVASNLEWMSIKDNNNYGSRTKRAAEANAKSVEMLDKSTGELLATYHSLKEAWRVTCINPGDISSCCLGKLKSAGGYKWRHLL